MPDVTDAADVELWNRRTHSTSRATVTWQWDHRTAVLSFAGLAVDPIEETGTDVFDALQHLRLRLEPLDLYPLCNGARVDCYPSGMARDMGGGLSVYVLTTERDGPPRLVRTFEPAAHDQVGSVAAQVAHHRRWLTAQRQRGSSDEG